MNFFNFKTLFLIFFKIFVKIYQLTVKCLVFKWFKDPLPNLTPWGGRAFKTSPVGWFSEGASPVK
jgi:hypothetical protein